MDFKESKGADVAPVMQQLISAVATLPVSTAACERGFSKMNFLCTPLPSKLTVAHTSSLLFISMVGPPVVKWNPMPYVEAVLQRGVVILSMWGVLNGWSRQMQQRQ